MIRRLGVALAASALLLAPVPAFAAQVAAPSLVQLCAATSVDEVDALLGDVAATDLVGELAPLLTLTVPNDAEALTLDADVSLDEVRDQLGCVDPDPEPSPVPTTDPTPAPTSTAVVPVPDGQDDGADQSDSDQAGGEPDDVDPTADDGSIPDISRTQVIEVPAGSADTGAL